MQDRFLWGAATSAHQVEGNNIHNDWWAWEKRHPAVVNSGRAADHYERFREDFALARELGHTAHRLSLEWSRIEPAEGVWSRHALNHYREVLEALRENGLTSFVTLHHFSNPQWLAERGGWEHKRTPQLFARYARMVAEQLGDLVDYWITFNEPIVYATHGWWRGEWPPGKRDWRVLLRVIRHLAYGHGQAYRAIHEELADARVGVAKHVVAYVPSDRATWSGRLAARWQNWWFNYRWLGMTRGSHDFIGVNYYHSQRPIRLSLWPWRLETEEWKGPTSDMGWPIWPQGLQEALRLMKQYRVPLYVTENGLADARDAYRADFIRDHIRAVEAVQEQGVDVRGYFYWSLLDNFEWADGFEPRFGLVAVDYDTMERTPRPSAQVYKAIIEQAQ